MSKVDELRRDALEAQFVTGSRPPEESYWDVFKAIQEAAQEHEHTPAGGPGTGTGDAAPVAFLALGDDTDKPEVPLPGQVYVAVDTQRLLVCFEEGTWAIVFQAP